MLEGRTVISIKFTRMNSMKVLLQFGLGVRTTLRFWSTTFNQNTITDVNKSSHLKGPLCPESCFCSGTNRTKKKIPTAKGYLYSVICRSETGDFHRLGEDRQRGDEEG